MIHDYKILESDSDHDNESPLHLSLPLISLQPNNFEMRGVKLELLLHLGKIILDIDNIEENWSIERVSNEVLGTHELFSSGRWNIKPEHTLTHPFKVSLIECLRNDYHIHSFEGISYDKMVGNATVFISFAYKSCYFELLQGLESFFHDNQEHDPNLTFFWFDPLVNNQWYVKEKNFDWWATTFKNAIGNIGCTVVIFSPWDRPMYITRAWTIFELYYSIETNCKIYFALGKEERKRLLTGLSLNGIEIIDDVFSTINITKCESFNPLDRESILDIIKATIGTDKVNSVIFEKLRSFMLDSCLQSLLLAENKVQKWHSNLSYARLLKHQDKLEESELIYEILVESNLGMSIIQYSTVLEYCEVLILNGKLDNALQTIAQVENDINSISSREYMEYGNRMEVDLLRIRMHELKNFNRIASRRFIEAISELEKCMIQREQLQGSYHRDFIRTLLLLSECWMKYISHSDRWDLTSHHGLYNFTALINTSHWSTSLCVDKLETIEVTLTSVLDYCRTALSSRHPLLLDVMEKLSCIRLRMISFRSSDIDLDTTVLKDARSMLSDSLKEYTSIFGTHHSTSIRRKRVTALMHDDGTSIELLKQALDTAIEFLGNDHNLTLELMIDIALILNGKFGLPIYSPWKALEGYRLFNEALELYSASRSAEDSDVIFARHQYIKSIGSLFFLLPTVYTTVVALYISLASAIYYNLTWGPDAELSNTSSFLIRCLGVFLLLFFIIGFLMLSIPSLLDSEAFWRSRSEASYFCRLLNLCCCSSHKSLYSHRRQKELLLVDQYGMINTWFLKEKNIVYVLNFTLAILFLGFFVSTLYPHQTFADDSFILKLKFSCPTLQSRFPYAYCGVRVCGGDIPLLASDCVYYGGFQSGETFIGLYNMNSTVTKPLQTSDHIGSCGSTGGSTLTYHTPPQLLCQETETILCSDDVTCHDYYLYEICYELPCTASMVVYAPPSANVSYFEVSFETTN